MGSWEKFSAALRAEERAEERAQERINQEAEIAELFFEKDSISDEEAQDSINNWIESKPEMQAIVDKYQWVSSPVGVLKKILELDIN